MRAGLHLSIGGGLRRTAQMAVRTGCQALQIFSGNPMGWKPSRPDPREVEDFRLLLLDHDVSPVYVHTPYLVNPAAPNPAVWAKSVEALAGALALAEGLGASYVVTHLGSHVGSGPEAGMGRLVEALSQVLSASSGPTLLLENNPGSRNELGSYFEELGSILERSVSVAPRLGVCLDTAHLWGAGYDLSTAQEVEETLARFHRLVGLENLHGIHANDSALARGARRDLHVAPGQGQIGMESFRALVNHPLLGNMSYILELPRVHDEDCIPALAQFQALAPVEAAGMRGQRLPVRRSL